MHFTKKQNNVQAYVNLTECVVGTFWLTDRNKAFKPGLSRLKRDVWYA